jgi:hypothetical protein
LQWNLAGPFGTNPLLNLAWRPDSPINTEQINTAPINAERINATPICILHFAIFNFQFAM